MWHSHITSRDLCTFHDVVCLLFISIVYFCRDTGCVSAAAALRAPFSFFWTTGCALVVQMIRRRVRDSRASFRRDRECVNRWRSFSARCRGLPFAVWLALFSCSCARCCSLLRFWGGVNAIFRKYDNSTLICACPSLLSDRRECHQLGLVM